MNPTASPPNLDQAEVDKFDRLSAEWWNPDGKFRPLHRFNPVRLGFLRDTLCAHFGRDPRAAQPLTGIRLLDIGCGGGLLSEPLARIGAAVVGVDPAPTNVEVARRHAAASGATVDYRASTAEALLPTGESFDAVLAMEVVEHVPDMPAFVTVCARLVRPGGIMVAATINRTLRAYALAIVGAEYVLRWLPRGTHDYARLVRPDELAAAMTAAGLAPAGPTGVVYNPLADSWRLSADTGVNYMLTATRAPTA